MTVAPANGSLKEKTDMVLTWNKVALTALSKPIEKAIHLTWTDPEGARYISFDAQGGSAVAQLTAGSGAAITWPVAPIKQGYTFGGWSTDDADVIGDSFTMPARPVAFTGSWTANTYTVTFNANSGSVSPASKDVIHNSAYGDLPIPTRDNYEFAGWYTQATGGTQVTKDTDVTITADQTLYAHWIEAHNLWVGG